MREKGEWIEGLDHPEENFLCATEFPEDCAQDAIEIGYPEKLTSIAIEWNITMVKRTGSFDSARSLHSDEDLISMAQAKTGGSDLYFNRVSSPQFESSWSSMRELIDPVLTGYPQWKFIVPIVFNEIEKTAASLN